MRKANFNCDEDGVPRLVQEIKGIYAVTMTVLLFNGLYILVDYEVLPKRLKKLQAAKHKKYEQKLYEFLEQWVESLSDFSVLMHRCNKNQLEAA